MYSDTSLQEAALPRVKNQPKDISAKVNSTRIPLGSAHIFHLAIIWIVISTALIHFYSCIIMCQDICIFIACLGHSISTPLAHSHAMAVAIGGEQYSAILH